MFDRLFLGSIEAAHDDYILCKNDIACLVDVSGLIPSRMAVPRRKSTCPCACSSKHNRPRLVIQLENNEDEDMVPYLNDVNSFVHAHLSKGRNVLIFCDTGRSRAPAMICQYLMQVAVCMMIMFTTAFQFTSQPIPICRWRT